MDERDMEILLELHKTKNITKAAQQLYVSQPSLTYRIKQIEKQIQHPIILRGTKGIEFTNEGELLIDYIRKQQHNYMQFLNSLHVNDEEVSGTLKIGVSGIYARYELPALLAAFYARYPKVDIHVVTGWSGDIHKLVLNEEVHVGIIRGDYNPTGTRIRLRQEQLFVVSKEPIVLEQLPERRAIVYGTDAYLKMTIEQWWSNTFTTRQKIAMQTDRSDTCYEMVLNGLGYAILPEICITDTSLNRLPLLHHGEPIYRDTWLTYAEHLRQLKQVDTFIREMTSL